MVCEDYRDGMMALLDDELTGPERFAVERHVRSCPHCAAEFDNFRRLDSLTHTVKFATPAGPAWEQYSTCVCRKIAASGGWVLWSAGAAFLTITGLLMLFSASECALAAPMGALLLVSGAMLLWLSNFCSCSKRG